MSVYLGMAIINNEKCFIYGMKRANLMIARFYDSRGNTLFDRIAHTVRMDESDSDAGEAARAWLQNYIPHSWEANDA